MTGKKTYKPDGVYEDDVWRGPRGSGGVVYQRWEFVKKYWPRAVMAVLVVIILMV